MKKLDYCPECSIELNSRESEMGFCQNCKHNWDEDDIDMEEDYYDEEYYEGEPNENCEKCGRTYDHFGYDYQYCKACGWDAENQKWDKPIKPTDADYLAGEADILTGRWW